MNIKAILKLGIFLMLVSAFFAFMLSLTYVVTKDKIEFEKMKEIKVALSQVLPKANNFGEIKSCIEKDGKYCIASTDKQKVGAVFMVAPKGYGGPIEMMVGIDTTGKVTGVKIISFTETPGLGTNAQNKWFLNQFKNKTSKDKLKAKKDIKALSGATITSQAIADGVNQALKLYQANH